MSAADAHAHYTMPGRGWARWFGILAAFIGAIAQIGFLAAFAIWSTIIIALGVFVLSAPTVRWEEARLALKE